MKKLSSEKAHPRHLAPERFAWPNSDEFCEHCRPGALAKRAQIFETKHSAIWFDCPPVAGGELATPCFKLMRFGRSESLRPSATPGASCSKQRGHARSFSATNGSSSAHNVFHQASNCWSWCCAGRVGR